MSLYLVFWLHHKCCQASVSVAGCWWYWAADFIYSTWPSLS